MKKIFIVIMIANFLGVVFSCSKEGNSDIEINTPLLDKSQEFKEIFQEKLPLLSELSERELSRSTEVNDNSAEVKEILSSLSQPLVDMLRSHGFTEKDWVEYEDINNPEFIIAGMMFLAMYEENASNTSVPFLKTRSEISGDDGSCWDIDRIIACVSTAIGIAEIYDLLAGYTCITKTIAWSIVKTVAKRVLGAAGVVIFMIEFGECMGWR